MNDPISTTQVTIEHVTLRSPKSFEAVRSALEASVPRLDHAYAELLLDGQVDAARDLLERQAPLSIFGARDHGGLLRTAGLVRKAVQYDIGNPLTAARMTRHILSAALYAPVRVLLREDAEGRVAFEYDRPATTFGQFGAPEVDGVARDLDEQLRCVLAAAAA
ncbi:DUF302 domain-containing protein [Methylobacterium sp. WL30]|uniref:DUF302 domain-containing protein n=1 Tax=unclassified Methylobacterium TaxID=2615210 RepID=UPI0011C93D0D|nr:MULTISPECIES: DUF302 domain-containing protein [unclassified Methylobacterium]TXM89696.1 DUF302 domain-containing protein [Methylobacterium sp. WL116]TXN25716.1 DUF302 domain-containing protein [Methylobacterium sp. WL93]TXN46208.1 DUF302 domain-containing protein [Methylobacterium sp. WL119]TXN64656.1 DUF302 domain-containing protein [Methylobacterium sp. WL30]